MVRSHQAMNGRTKRDNNNTNTSVMRYAAPQMCTVCKENKNSEKCRISEWKYMQKLYEIARINVILAKLNP